MVITLKDYKEIRQRYLSGESIRSIAKRMHMSRQTVKRYSMGDSIPGQRKTPVRQSSVMTADVSAFIQSCLERDAQENLPKQKHTAKRIYDRLVEELHYAGGESTVRNKVKELKGHIPKAFIPLQFDLGEAMQVDWGQAQIYLNDIRTVVYLFCARLCGSCRPVVLAYRHQNEESFLHAFVRTFQILGGVPAKVIFDNGRVAVKEGFGAYAKKQSGYTALSAHYAFDAVFCNPAQGHEKGLVEGLVGWARRNICVPVPHVSSLEELNTQLLENCLRYEKHHIQGKSESVGALFLKEKALLRPLPHQPFETAKCTDVRVSTFSTVRFMTNEYSVPVRYVGCRVGVKGYPETVEIYLQGQCISAHARCYETHQKMYHLEDYLPLLETRNRAILDAAPVKQNLPPEAIRDMENHKDNPAILIKILQKYTWSTADHQKLPVIEDPVPVKPIDLHVYDALETGG